MGKYYILLLFLWLRIGVIFVVLLLNIFFINLIKWVFFILFFFKLVFKIWVFFYVWDWLFGIMGFGEWKGSGVIYFLFLFFWNFLFISERNLWFFIDKLILLLLGDFWNKVLYVFKVWCFFIWKWFLYGLNCVVCLLLRMEVFIIWIRFGWWIFLRYIFLIMIYFNFSFWVNGVFFGLVIWWNIWCVFGIFLLINSLMFIFFFIGGSLLIIEFKW